MQVHFSAITYNFWRRLSWQECIDELKYLYRNESPSYSTVKIGLMNSIMGDDRITAIVQQNIDAVRELIMQDRQVHTVR